MIDVAVIYSFVQIVKVCMSPMFKNDCNSLTYRCSAIKSDVYEASVNPEESFKEGLFYNRIEFCLH